MVCVDLLMPFDLNRTQATVDQLNILSLTYISGIVLGQGNAISVNAVVW